MTAGIKNFCALVGVYLVPLLSIMALELLLYIPRSNGFWNFLRQAPFYAGIYFWLVQRPDSFNLLSAFILGILADVIGGAPLGVNIITFLVLYMLSARLSAYFNIQKFSYSWLLFTVIVLLVLFFKALLVSVFYRTMIPFNFLLFEYLLTVTAYPLLVRFYTWVERRYIHLEECYEKV